MKKLERDEMKKLKGGLYGGGDGGDARWCATSSDCPSLTYTCPSGGIYQTGQGSCRWNTFPPHCVWGFVCQ